MRRDGRDAIAAELAAWWDGPGEVGEWRAGEWPAGAALTAARDGVRRRHYLHLSGDLIARHWVYAMAPASLGGGNSGATLERVTLPDGTPGIAKRVVPGGDWLGRAAGGRAITAELWHAGVLQRLPASIETGIVAVEPDGDGWRILMRDLSAALLPADGPISRARHREVMAAAAALHAAFRGERVDGAITLERHLAISSPAVAAAERDGSDVIPKQLAIAWEAFAEAADDDVAQAVLANLRDPAPLARALRAGGTTLVHGDLRDENLGFADGRVVLLDWDIAGEGTPALEVAWYLCHDAWRTQATHDELLEDFLAAEGGAGQRARPRPRAHRRPAALRLDLRPQRGRPPRPGRARLGARGARVVGPARARRARAHGRDGVMRAAVLHGPDDLRVEEVAEPAGEVLVEVRAATTCGTDRKMLRHGHRILGDYPARFGHETAGVRADTGERVFVGDSVALRSLRTVPRGARGDLPRADLGAGRLRRAHRGAARRPCTRSPTAWTSPGRRWPSRWPPACTRWRAAPTRPTSPSWAAGRSGSCSRACWRSTGATSSSATATPSAAPRPRRSARARRTRSASTTSSSRRSGATRRGSRPWPPRAPAAPSVLVGGCPGGTTVALDDRAAALRRGRRARRLSPHARRGRSRAGAAGRRRRRLARAGGARRRPGGAGRRPAGADRRRGAQARGGSGRDESAALALALCALAWAPAARAACPPVPAPPSDRRARERRADRRLRPRRGARLAGDQHRRRRLQRAGPPAALRGRLRPARAIACARALARLRAVRAGRARSAGDAPAVVWVAGSVHGNEPTGGRRRPAPAARARRGSAATRCCAAWSSSCSPIRTPTAASAHTRVNANGFDLNRDWLALTQPESQARLRLLLAMPPLAYVDQHEQGGAGVLRAALLGAVVPRAARRGARRRARHRRAGGARRVPSARATRRAATGPSTCSTPATATAPRRCSSERSA